MRIYRHLSELQGFRNAVVTIGSFDGVHKGHQKILARLRQLAREVDGESVLITFHPHPRLVVYPDDGSLRLLSTVEEKIQLAQRYGLDHIVIVPFTKEFSQLSPFEYIRGFLVHYFRPARIVIGYDHHFGNKRAGDIHLLRQYAPNYGYQVEEIPKQEIESIAVSSTKVRAALGEGRISAATGLLGHYYSLTGKVARGEAIGRKLGFPTANIEVGDKRKLLPANGIYAVFVHFEGERYEGMLYLGDRPTLEDLDNHVCEVNIFEFDREIYDEYLKVEFVAHIRDDAKFQTLDGLKRQLIQDKANALALLGRTRQEEKAVKKKPLPKVAVVILNYNGVDYLRQMLPTVLASTYPNMQVVVADNGSKDESVRFLRRHYPDIKLLEFHENHGFAEGYNKALDKLDASYYILLNSDAAPEPDWVEPIIELMERDRQVGACQPKIKDYNQRSRFEYAGAAGGWMDKWGYPFCRGRMFDTVEEDKGQYDTAQEVFWASGAAMFVRAELYKGLGGLDGSLFAHMEEIDFCWRLKRAGYKVMVEPRSVVYHVGGGTLDTENPRKTFLNFRNSLIVLWKNEHPSKLTWLIPLRLVLDGVAGARFALKGRFKLVRAIVDAHWDFFRKAKDYKAGRPEVSDAIEKISIGRTNREGVYRKSIVWQYFARRKRQFRRL